jgi:glycerophosphoryl diester phosphodiesterase
MKAFAVLALSVLAVAIPQARALEAAAPHLYCHRTANEDVPENTMESLEQAVLLGCNLVEIDIRRTVDGQLVLNHDGVLERLTDGTGEAENSFYGDLETRDFGAWMGERFTGLHVARFEDALRYAHDHDIRLYLDMKTKGMAPEILRMLDREDMLHRVQFGGNWDDVKPLYPEANAEQKMVVWVQPGVTAAQVNEHHAQGKTVVANFSANDHDMDLDAMKAAVAAGVDAINVDYPRLGADAVGRPVEGKLHALALQANAGESQQRITAILQLARYRGFALEDEFDHWLLDPDPRVSRAAAVALATARPRTQPSAFADALVSKQASTRANAAWALGVMHAPAGTVLPLLHDPEPKVLQAALIAIAHMPGDVSVKALLPLLSHDDRMVQGAAALALAKHHPDIAAKVVPEQLAKMMQKVLALWNDYVAHGKPKLSEADSDNITNYYRAQLNMVQAIAMLKGPAAQKALEQQAFRPGQDFSWSNAMVSSFQLWDRIGEDPAPAVKALNSGDLQVENRAEWMLVNGGAAVLPEVRKSLNDSNPAVRHRAIRIVAWQGDRGSLDALRALSKTPEDAELAAWAIDKIESQHPRL